MRQATIEMSLFVFSWEALKTGGAFVIDCWAGCIMVSGFLLRKVFAALGGTRYGYVVTGL
jgi:hypothetical protein